MSNLDRMASTETTFEAPGSSTVNEGEIPLSGHDAHSSHSVQLEAIAPTNEEIQSGRLEDGTQLYHDNLSNQNNHSIHEDISDTQKDLIQSNAVGPSLPAASTATAHPIVEKAVEWRPIMIRTPSLAIVLFFDVGLMVAILILDIISIKNSGFATVQDQASIPINLPLIGSLWRQALLWTVLPNLIFQLYNSVWSSIVSGLMNRQPYVELKSGEARAERSIMLDYRTNFSFMVGYKAIRNCHFVTGVSALLGLALSFAVVPLTSHLFETASVILNSTVPATFIQFYNDSAITAFTDLRSVFDIVSATRIYGGFPLVWTDAQYAYQAFSAPAAISSTANSIGNLTISTIAYSAYLSCEIIDSAIYEFQNGVLTLSYVDRGCDVSSSSTPVRNGIEFYINTWPTETCSPESGFSRFGALAGQYSPADNETYLSNKSVISCIPTYWTTTGELTVTTNGPPTTPMIKSFLNTSASVRIDRGTAWTQFETMLHEYVTSTPTSLSYETDIGRLIFTYATRQLSSASPPDANTLVASASAIFTTVFAVLANTILFEPISGTTFIDINGSTIDSSISAIFSSTQTRLLVVSPIAYAIIGVLFLIALCIVTAAVYTERHHSILHEEPVGLLSYAAILKGSDVNKLVDEIILKGEKEEVKSPRWKLKWLWKWSKSDVSRETQRHNVEDGLSSRELDHGDTNNRTETGNNDIQREQPSDRYLGRPRKVVEDHQLLKEGRWGGRWKMVPDLTLERIACEWELRMCSGSLECPTSCNMFKPIFRLAHRTLKYIII